MLRAAETHVSVTGARRARRPAPPLPPPRFVCLGAPLATCALPKGVCTCTYLPVDRPRRSENRRNRDPISLAIVHGMEK